MVQQKFRCNESDEDRKVTNSYGMNIDRMEVLRVTKRNSKAAFSTESLMNQNDESTADNSVNKYV